MLLTPLEQFQIISYVPLLYSVYDFSVTNILLINIFLIFILSFIFFFIFKKDDTLNFAFFLIPNSWQFLIESFYEISLQLVNDNLGEKGEKYFPFISVLFFFIVFNNLIGLIPYSFTITSHLIVTFSISFSIFVGLNIIGFNIHNINLFSLFIPANSSFYLSLLLVPIEFVSYVFKPISLGVRLFANLMAGHTLLKVIVGFSWSMLFASSIISLFHIFPLIVLIILMGLELGVALIQAYVFTILTCIYINDNTNLH